MEGCTLVCGKRQGKIAIRREKRIELSNSWFSTKSIAVEHPESKKQR